MVMTKARINSLGPGSLVSLYSGHISMRETKEFGDHLAMVTVQGPNIKNHLGKRWWWRNLSEYSGLHVTTRGVVTRMGPEPTHEDATLTVSPSIHHASHWLA